MGTNFYVIIRPPCPKCGDAVERIHIGKLSAGWAFLFRSYPLGAPDNPAEIPRVGITSYRAWVSFLKDRTIRDEYGDLTPLEDLLALIHGSKAGLTARTASEMQWGPSGREFEHLDADGYRLTDREFS